MSSPLPLRKVKLNNGQYIPVLGFGTGTSQAWTDTTPVVSTALSLGLNHMDCAHHYKNQHFTGAAIKSSGLKREDVWVTTKAGSFQGKAEDFDAWWYIKENLRDVSHQSSYWAKLPDSQLGLEYVDLFLVSSEVYLLKSMPTPDPRGHSGWIGHQGVEADGGDPQSGPGSVHWGLELLHGESATGTGHVRGTYPDLNWHAPQGIVLWLTISTLTA